MTKHDFGISADDTELARDPVVRQVVDVLEQSAHLEADVVQALDARRRAAIGLATAASGQRGGRGWASRWRRSTQWRALAGVAATVTLVLIVNAPGPIVVTAPAPVAYLDETADLVAELDLLEELEFLAWLDEEGGLDAARDGGSVSPDPAEMTHSNAG